MAFNFVPNTGTTFWPGGTFVSGTIAPAAATDWAIMVTEGSGPVIAGWTTESGYIHKQLSSAAPFSLSYPSIPIDTPVDPFANILAAFPTTGAVSVAQQIGNVSGFVGAGTYTFPNSGPPTKTVTAGNSIFVLISKESPSPTAADPVVTDTAGHIYEKAYVVQTIAEPDTSHYSVGAGLYVARNIPATVALAVQVVLSDQVDSVQVIEMSGIGGPARGFTEICLFGV